MLIPVRCLGYDWLKFTRSAFRLPTTQAAYIGDYSFVNIVYFSAVTTLYLHHIQMTIPDMHPAEPTAGLEDGHETSNHICTHTWRALYWHNLDEIKTLTTLLTLSKDALYGISTCRKMEHGCWKMLLQDASGKLYQYLMPQAFMASTPHAFTPHYA